LNFILSSWIVCYLSLKTLSRNVRQDISCPLYLSAPYLHVHEIHFRLPDVPPSYPNNTVKELFRITGCSVGTPENIVTKSVSGV
jgi:hypothetical protein